MEIHKINVTHVMQLKYVLTSGFCGAFYGGFMLRYCSGELNDFTTWRSIELLKYWYNPFFSREIW